MVTAVFAVVIVILAVGYVYMDTMPREPFNRFASKLIAHYASRQVDVTIGMAEDGVPYMRRWFVIPRNRVLNIYLHCFQRSDDDRALHDHPWLFNASVMLRGGYVEHTIAAGGVNHRRWLEAGSWRFRWGPAPHRVELIGAEPKVWTLFITGPVVRRWGFHCPDRWVHWTQFTHPDDSGKIGRGCGPEISA